MRVRPVPESFEYLNFIQNPSQQGLECDRLGYAK
jgi:hypothetical protein